MPCGVPRGIRVSYEQGTPAWVRGYSVAEEHSARRRGHVRQLKEREGAREREYERQREPGVEKGQVVGEKVKVDVFAPRTRNINLRIVDQGESLCRCCWLGVEGWGATVWRRSTARDAEVMFESSILLQRVGFSSILLQCVRVSSILLQCVKSVFEGSILLQHVRSRVWAQSLFRVWGSSILLQSVGF